jgi:hypothetical protein
MKDYNARILLNGINPFLRLSLFSIITLIAAWFSFASAVAMSYRQENPVLAMRLDPKEAAALAKQADIMLATDVKKNRVSAITNLAEKALLSEPINPRALRVLGTVYNNANDSSKGSKFFNLAAQQSRRELGVNIWLVEQAIADNNAKQALYYYDIVLRSDSRGKDLLFPKLTQAIGAPEIRVALLPYLKSDAPWMSDFVNYSTYYDANISGLAQLVLLAGGLPKTANYAEARFNLIEKLFQKGDLQNSLTLGKLTKTEAGPASISVALIQTNVDPQVTPFQWRTIDLDSGSSGFEAGPKNGVLSLVGWSGFGKKSVVASKILSLSQGRYKISVDGTTRSQDQNSRAVWVAYCHDGAKKSEMSRLDVAKQTAAKKSMEVAISSNCIAQSLELEIDGGRDPEGTTVEISNISISKN